MELSSIVLADKANPRKEGVKSAPKKSPFAVKVNYDKDLIVIARKKFEEMGVPDNSLAHGVDPKDPSKIYIVVMPGNSGVWAKTQAGAKTKASRCKNKDLVSKIKAGGLGDNEKFNLERAGEKDGATYYLLVPYNPNKPVQETTEQDSEDRQESEVPNERSTFDTQS